MVVFYHPAHAEDDEEADDENSEEGRIGDFSCAPRVGSVTSHGGR